MNVVIDYYGIVNLLRQLVEKGGCTYLEAKKIALGIAIDFGIDTDIGINFCPIL